ncbi:MULTISPECIES: hypothetical protein [Mesonia]|uniref:Uncharacterized protein n=1 Tax=Mesonia oceanica TaxID=2687242 RepID=A0AC61YAH9_9FLAO|nr:MULTISPECIES: hypothetical protein [Mesonia]MAN29361.1 hypothetical protein [Mesonia sp.]MAQ41608.1 hypothetical protein [Mesonia sp.]VVV01446.1 hypothetical protein FVB9532_02738 [Mesonia oceanica]|tara:strand:+ start:609 stop:1214 length:606 start_codon:yes stop_codon:yes gene_type:complete
MKKITYLFFLLTFSVFSQSQYVYNFKNSDSLDSYIQKNNLVFHPEDVYITKDFESFKAHTQTSFFASPIIFVFNKEGKYLESIDNISAERKLSNFKRIRKKPDKDQLSIEFLTEKIAHYKSGEVYNDAHSYTYTFVINWMLVSGEQKPIIIKLLNEWYSVLLRQKKAGENIKIILLNIEPQDHWGLSQTWREYVLENLNRS